MIEDLFARGGPIMWPLLLCSLVSLTVIIERLICFGRERLRSDEKRLLAIFERAESGDHDGALKAAGPNPDRYVRVLLSGLAHRERGLVEGMEVAANEEIARMRRGLGVLDTIVTMAPMLGLLGTVIGIILSFDILGTYGVENPMGVASGIAQALITTAAGLIISLVTLVPYNFFVSRVTDTTRRLEQLTTRFEVAYRKGLEHAADPRI